MRTLRQRLTEIARKLEVQQPQVAPSEPTLPPRVLPPETQGFDFIPKKELLETPIAYPSNETLRQLWEIQKPKFIDPVTGNFNLGPYDDIIWSPESGNFHKQTYAQTTYRDRGEEWLAQAASSLENKERKAKIGYPDPETGKWISLKKEVGFGTVDNPEFDVEKYIEIMHPVEKQRQEEGWTGEISRKQLLKQGTPTWTGAERYTPGETEGSAPKWMIDRVKKMHQQGLAGELIYGQLSSKELLDRMRKEGVNNPIPVLGKLINEITGIPGFGPFGGGTPTGVKPLQAFEGMPEQQYGSDGVDPTTAPGWQEYYYQGPNIPTYDEYKKQQGLTPGPGFDTTTELYKKQAGDEDPKREWVSQALPVQQPEKAAPKPVAVQPPKMTQVLTSTVGEQPQQIVQQAGMELLKQQGKLTPETQQQNLVNRVQNIGMALRDNITAPAAAAPAAPVQTPRTPGPAASLPTISKFEFQHPSKQPFYNLLNLAKSNPAMSEFAFNQAKNMWGQFDQQGLIPTGSTFSDHVLRQGVPLKTFTNWAMGQPEYHQAGPALTGRI